MISMKYTVLAPVGDNLDALFVGIREFPTEKIILLTPEDLTKIAEKVKKDLERFKIPTNIVKVKGDQWEGIFKVISEISNRSEGNLLINVATGDRDTQCAATSAAFVNGVRAFSVSGNNVMLLPVLKFNYYKLLTDKKLKILKTIFNEKSCCASLDELSKMTKMSLPLISYHINGSSKSEGLKEMGLVETEDVGGRRIKVTLSMLGRLLIEGHLN